MRYSSCLHGLKQEPGVHRHPYHVCQSGLHPAYLARVYSVFALRFYGSRALPTASNVQSALERSSHISAGHMAPVAGSRVVRGEARVTYLKSKYAVLSKPGLDGSIFVVPSHIMGQQFGYPDMHDLLSLNDIVEFEAVPQEEQNGIKWQALDGTVKVRKRASEVEYRDQGIVTFLDERMGQYGFLETAKGSVWFNANVVRPETKDVAKVLKKGQQVHFVAVKQTNKQPHSNCQYRATLVHGKNWKKCPTAGKVAPGKTAIQKQLVRPESETVGLAAWSVSSGSRDSSRPSTPGPLLQVVSGESGHLNFNSSFSERFGSFADVASASPLPQSPSIPALRHPRTQPLDIILSSESKKLDFNPTVGSHSTNATTSAWNGSEETRAVDTYSDGSYEGTTAANGALSIPPPAPERDTYDRQLIFLQRIAHKLLGITNASQCPVCEPSAGWEDSSIPE